jgi:hypothetical protein
LELSYSEGVRTSAFVSRLYKFSLEIDQLLSGLCEINYPEKDFVEIANFVGDWLANADVEYHSSIAEYHQLVPPAFWGTLMAVLSDMEFSTESRFLLDSTIYFLESNDKYLAQTAAIFLTYCGGKYGIDLLQQALSTQELPHRKLVQGVSKLLEC